MNVQIWLACCYYRPVSCMREWRFLANNHFPFFLGAELDFISQPLSQLCLAIYTVLAKRIQKWPAQLKSRLLRRFAYSILSWLIHHWSADDDETLEGSGIIWGKLQPCVKDMQAAQEQPPSPVMWVKNKLLLYLIHYIFWTVLITITCLYLRKCSGEK